MAGGLMDVLTQDILVTCILMGLIALVGLVGNSLMLRALIKYRTLRTDFYTVFAALSIADSLFLIISVPAHIMDMVQATEEITVGWCKGSHYLINTCGFIAAYLVVVLAVLRGILLTNRNTIRRPQARHLVVVCVLFYAIAIFSSIPIVYMFTSYDGFCDFAPGAERQRETWLVSSFSAFVPLFLVFLIYFMTYMLGKRYFSDSYSPGEKEKSRMVSSIILAFCICQMPYRIVAICNTYTDPDDYEELNKMYIIQNYLMCLVMADKAVRPVLYSKLASDLSEAFDEVINCTYCSRPYNMGPMFDHPAHMYAPAPSSTYTIPTTPNTISTYVSSTESQRNGDRCESTSSSASASSQTPLTRKEDEIIEMNIEVHRPHS